MAETKIKLSIDGVQTVVTGMKQVGETVGQVSNSLTALTAIGGSLSIGALANMVKASIDAADNLNDLSKTTKISVEQLAGLKLAAQQSGTELDGVAKAINKLTVNMGKDAEKFEKLGISAKEPIEAFKQLATITKQLEDPQLKAAFLTEALGKSWEEVAPLLNEGGERIAEMVEKGQRLAGVTQEMADRSDEFNDALVVLGAAMGGFKTRIAADVLPLLNVLMGDLSETAERTDDLGDSFNPLTETLRALVVLGGNVSFVLKGVGTEIGGMAAQIAALASGDIAGFLAIGEMMKKDAMSAREAFDAWEKRVMEATPRITKEAQEVNDELDRIAARAKAAADARAREFVADKDAANKAAEAARKAGAEAQRENEAQAKLLAEMSGLAGDFAEKWDRLNKMYVSGKLSLEKLTEAQAKLLALQPAIKKANDEELRQAKLLADEWEEAAQARAEYDKQYLDKQNAAIRGVNDYIKGIEETNRLTEFEIGLLGQTAEQRAVALAQYGIQLGLEQEILRVRELGLDATTIEAEVSRLRAAALQANVGAVRRAELDQWNSTWASVDRTAHDTFVSIFDSGKNTFDRLKDTLENGLLDLLYQMTVRQWIFNIGASVGGIQGGTGMPGGGAVNGIFQGANLLQTGKMIWDGFSGGLAANLGGIVQTVGTTLNSATLVNVGSGIKGAIGSASGVGAGNIIGQVMPYVGAVAAIYSIIKSFDDSGTIHTGGAGSYSAAKGGATLDARSLGFMRIDTTNDANQASTAIASNIVAILDGTAKSFGQQVGYSAATAFADDNSDDGAWGALRIMLGDRKVLDWDDQRASRWAPREYADGEAGRTEYIKNLGVSVRQALDQMDLPGWADEMLGALGDTPTIEAIGQVVSQINAAQQAFANIGNAITAFAGLTDAARVALVKAAGGIDSLVAGLDSFYDGYYTEAEKMANVSRQMEQSLAKFNIALPTTREEFRAIVEAQMALGEAGAPAVAELLRVAGTFGMLADYSKRLADTVEDTATTVETAADRFQRAEQLRSTALSLVDVSFGTLQRSVEAERNSLRTNHEQAMTRLRDQLDIVNGRVGKLSSLSGALRNTVDGMQLPSQLAASRAAASAQIEAALAIARAGGAFPTAESLSGALGTLSQPAEDLFATREDFQRDFLRNANRIDELADLTDTQLTIEEQTRNLLQDQIKAEEEAFAAEMARLDGILTTAQAEVDTINGVNTSVLSVAQAIQNLAGALASARAVGAGQTGASAGTAAIGTIADAYRTYLHRDPEAAGLGHYIDRVSNGASVGDAVWSIANSPEAKVQQMYQAVLGRVGEAEGVAHWVAAVNAGMSMADLEWSFKNSEEALAKLPQLDVGTNRVTKDMPAMIHEDERIMPAADNRELMERLRSPIAGTAEMVAAINRLDRRMATIETNTAEGANAAKDQKMILDAVIRGDAKFATEPT